MSGMLKTVVVVLVLGATCLGAPPEAAAWIGEPEEEPPGLWPLYYLQLQEFDKLYHEEADGETLEPMLLEYLIQPGDSLYSIARRFDTDIETLVSLNGIKNPHFIKAGEILEVLTVPGAVHDVKEGDTIASIAALYKVDKETIIAANDLEGDGALKRGERIIVPGAQLSRSANVPLFRWPLKGRITSGFGPRGGGFHYGVDIGAPVGTPFYAAACGRVTHAGYLGSYGIMVEVEHGGGFVTRYAHASRTAVPVGEYVTQGQVLGYVGLTGHTTGPHLHFELHRNGERLNPLDHLY